MPSRRHVLTAAALWATSGLAAPALAIGDLELNLVRQRTGEAFKGPLTRQGLPGSHLDKDALGKLNTLMRDVRAKKATEMGIDLIAISILREQGVLLTAIIVAGRTGSAFGSRTVLRATGGARDHVQGFGSRGFVARHGPELGPGRDAGRRSILRLPEGDTCDGRDSASPPARRRPG